MSAFFRNILHPKSQSLFIKILSFFLMMCLLLTGLFSVFSATILYSELEERLYHSNINLMSLTDTTADVLMGNVEASICAASQNSTIISAVIAPDMSRTQRNYEVVHYLNTTAENLTIISRILLYVSYDKTVFTSEGAVTTLDACLDAGIIRRHLEQQKKPVNWSNPGGSVSLHIYEGKLYCCLDFPLEGSYCNGTLFFEINQRVLYDELNCQTEHDVFIYNEENRALFARPMEGLGALLTPEVLQNMRENGSGTLPREMKAQSIVYYYAAPGSWLYVYPVPLEILSGVLGGLIKIILPMFLLSLLLSAALSSYLSHAIYQPIRHLTALVSKGKRKWVPSERTLSELEFLGVAYQDAVKSNDLLTGIVERSADAMMEKMLCAIMLGREYEPKEVKENLQVLNTPFTETGVYLVMAMYITQQDGAQLTMLQTDLYKASVDNLIQSIVREQCAHMAVTIDAGYIAMVICFDEKTPAEEIAQTASSAMTAVRQEGTHLPCNILCGAGKTYRSIYDLKYSYREALEKIHYQSYTRVAAPVEENYTDEASQTDYAERARQLSEELCGVQPDSAMLSVRVLDEFFAGNPTLDVMRGRLMILADMLYEYTGDQMDGASDLEPKEEALRRMRQITSVPQLREWADGLCTAAADFFSVCNSRKKYRYVLRAKEYIEEHMSEPTLSLNDVAASLNITPTYLSRLFKEYQQRNFIDYVNEMRIRRAMMYLSTTDLSISEIGFKCGFSSAQNFTRVFKKYKQVPPGQYRSSLKQD